MWRRADYQRLFAPAPTGSLRAGAAAGSLAPPQVWRRASRPLVAALQHGRTQPRPRLGAPQREALLDGCLDDIALLESVLSESFDDWRSTQGRGSFAERAAASSAQTSGAAQPPTS
ncbi:MAG TPA: hypothetical protein VEQ66_06490 [Propionibacteriaceae bacterium]|nr:hypothetical protein [Propionibacteriaceae bacterium]